MGEPGCVMRDRLSEPLRGQPAVVKNSDALQDQKASVSFSSAGALGAGPDGLPPFSEHQEWGAFHIAHIFSWKELKTLRKN